MYKCQLTRFPRKGRVHSFRMVLIQRLCSTLGCLSVGARRACMPTVSDMYIDEVGKQIVWSKQKEYSGQSFPEERFLSHQQLNSIEFPSTL